ncbi:MAG: hypothetical protein ACRD9S_03215 [Pyrinomonadaceae bacterium]
MQDSKNLKADGPDSSATSKETLEDLEKDEEVSDSENAEHDSSPSPDGELDEPDEIKDAGPM